MVNILIPIAGKSRFFESTEANFPKPLFEIRAKPMIEYVVDYLKKITGPKKFVFVCRQEDCLKYHLDNTLYLLAGPESTVIQQVGETKGAACSSLLASEIIDNDDELIISNGDQFIDADISAILEYFRRENADAGVINFESVHPQWSYVAKSSSQNSNEIIEVAEKNPISRNAIAGFYYFRKGKFFVESSFDMIRKQSDVNGMFFISPVLNEMILKGKKCLTYQIPNEKYYSFYSVDRIREYENEYWQNK